MAHKHEMVSGHIIPIVIDIIEWIEDNIFLPRYPSPQSQGNRVIRTGTFSASSR